MFSGWSAFQILLAILGVGFLIAFHELGHYWVARKTGMRVLRYSIGFGPALWHKTINDIEYRVALLPLGGFVHIPASPLFGPVPGRFGGPVRCAAGPFP